MMHSGDEDRSTIEIVISNQASEAMRRKSILLSLGIVKGKLSCFRSRATQSFLLDAHEEEGRFSLVPQLSDRFILRRTDSNFL